MAPDAGCPSVVAWGEWDATGAAELLPYAPGEGTGRQVINDADEHETSDRFADEVALCDLVEDVAAETGL